MSTGIQADVTLEKLKRKREKRIERNQKKRHRRAYKKVPLTKWE